MDNFAQRVILPRHNEADLDDVPDVVRETMEFILVDTVDEVLAAALTPAQESDDRANGLHEPAEIKENWS